MAETLRSRYAARLEALAERKRRAEQAVAREKEETTSQGIQTAISIGATVLGALLGRKAVSATNIGRATTAARGAGRTIKQAGDVGRAKENVAAIDQQIADLAELKAELRPAGRGDGPGHREARDACAPAEEVGHLGPARRARLGSIRRGGRRPRAALEVS